MLLDSQSIDLWRWPAGDGSSIEQVTQIVIFANFGWNSTP
jgi:hypothetical protein